MTVPSFQEWFWPLLRRVVDGKDHHLSDLYEGLANDMELSEEDRLEMLPSGKQLLFRNRIGWARTYMQKAGLLMSPTRGMVRITDRGRSVHKEKPENLNVTYLKQYPEFVEFHTYKGPKKKSPSDGDSEVPDSPEVALEQAYEHIKGGVTRDLLDQVKDGTPSWFEGLVVKLLRKMGYGGPGPDAAQVVGGSGDGGVDGIIKQDQLGLDIVYIQAKRWENPVGRPEVQKFAGSLDGFSANKGVMITTSTFSKGAHEYANSINKNIVLIEGEKLSELMFEHNIGVTTEIAYEVKKIDTDFFFDD